MWEEGSQTRWFYVCLRFTHGENFILIGRSFPQAFVGFQTIIVSSFTYPHTHPNSFMKDTSMYMF